MNRILHSKTKAGKLIPALSFFILFASAAAQAQTISNNKNSTAAVAKAQAEQQKLAFIQNKGQWPAHILYKADLPGAQALVTKDGMIAGIFDPQSLAALNDYSLKSEERHKPGKQATEPKPQRPSIRGHGWKIKFLNANPIAKQSVEKQGESRDYYNFLSNEGNATNIHSYAEVTYRNVYDGIDVRYYGTADNLSMENDIIVKPGADAAKVSFTLEGIDNFQVDESGNLILHTEITDIKMPAPVTYMVNENGKRTPVLSRYIQYNNKSIGFAIAEYDHTKKLVIDPIVMRWATWVSNNGAGIGHNHGIDLDPAGNIYAGGFYNSPGLITVGAFQSTSGGGTDAFMAKYTEPATPGGAGVRVWQTYFGSIRSETIEVLKVGPDGFIYALGGTLSDLATTYGTGFTPPGYSNRSSLSGTNGLLMVLKLNASGTGAQVRTLGATSQAIASSPGAIDLKLLPGAGSSFDLVISATCFTDINFAGSGDIPQPITPAGVAHNSPEGQDHIFIARISPDFNTINWTRLIGSNTAFEDIDVFATSIDAANNIYLGGSTNAASSVSFNNPSTQTTRIGSIDAFLMKLDASGVVLNSRYFNGNSGRISIIICMDIAPDYTGIVIGGYSNGLAAANITAGAYQTTIGGVGDFFVDKLPLSLASTTWGTYLGGNGDEANMTGIRFDAAGMLYIAGYTSSTNYITTANPVQNINMASSSFNAVFTKLNGTGTTVLYSTYLGGSTKDFDPIGNSAIAFYNCRTYLALSGQSGDFPLTSGAITTNKLSANSISEPILVSMASPPDMNTYNFTPNSQSIACGASPSPITSTAPTYNIASISRSNIVQTNGTPSAYPSGLPVITGGSYQWQRSIDNGVTWTSIAGATALTLSSAQMGAVVQDTRYRMMVNNDNCVPPSPIAYVSVGGDPSTAPSAICGGGNATISANATGTSPFTYIWNLPTASTRPSPGNVSSFGLTGVLPTDGGVYQVTVINAGGCRVTRSFLFNANNCNLTVLAVKLVSFNAAKDVSGTKAILNWQSNQEINFSHYQVERSKDGVNYEVIGTVYGQSVNGEKADYSFIDAMPQAGINYYRLLMVNKDGKGNYSSIRALNFTKTGITLLVYPSPAKDMVTVSGIDAGMQLRIIANDGKLAGTYGATGATLTIPITKLPGGTYILQALNNNVVVATTKLIKE